MTLALILFILLLVTGVLWCADFFVFKKKRPAGARDPWWVEYGASFFPVVVLVFGLRSFVVEPFKIPSGSMLPTLLVGDFILVNKYAFGIRLPIINQKIMDVGTPQRGDVMVFRYPKDESLDYIKRVVGLPGDKIAYQNKRLTINGVEMKVTSEGEFLDNDKLIYTPRYKEMLDKKEHAILIDPAAPPYIPQAYDFPNRDNCLYNNAGVICTVPPGHYFMMGDNRDASADSRFWGFVPDRNIVGKAVFIWWNFSDLKRIGGFN